MCDIAEGIYEALVKLENHPDKFLDQNFMMAIFDNWTKGNPQVEEWTTYTYVDVRKPTLLIAQKSTSECLLWAKF